MRRQKPMIGPLLTQLRHWPCVHPITKDRNNLIACGLRPDAYGRDRRSSPRRARAVRRIFEVTGRQLLAQSRRSPSPFASGLTNAIWRTASFRCECLERCWVQSGAKPTFLTVIQSNKIDFGTIGPRFVCAHGMAHTERVLPFSLSAMF
jgi:hypothetical protein